MDILVFNKKTISKYHFDIHIFIALLLTQSAVTPNLLVAMATFHDLSSRVGKLCSI